MASTAVSKAASRGSTPRTPARYYWYFTTYSECPVCRRGETTRERRFTSKPEAVHDRYEYVQSYDWCNVL